MLRRTVSTVQPRAAAHPHEQELVVKVLEAVLTTTDRLPHRDSVADGGEGASELHNVQRPVCVGLPRVEENVVLELHTLDRVWKVPNVRRGDDVVCAATARTKCRKCAVAGVASRASVTRTLRCVAKQRCALRRRGPVRRRAAACVSAEVCAQSAALTALHTAMTGSSARPDGTCALQRCSRLRHRRTCACAFVRRFWRRYNEATPRRAKSSIGCTAADCCARRRARPNTATDANSATT